MMAARIARGFHRIGLVVALPCALGVVAALLIALGLWASPRTVGPVFGLDDRDIEVTAPGGESFRFKETLDLEQRGLLTAERRALLEEARRRGLLPMTARSETREATEIALAVAGVLFVLGLAWYGVMRAIAWVLAGFLG